MQLELAARALRRWDRIRARAPRRNSSSAPSSPFRPSAAFAGPACPASDAAPAAARSLGALPLLVVRIAVAVTPLPILPLHEILLGDCLMILRNAPLQLHLHTRVSEKNRRSALRRARDIRFHFLRPSCSRLHSFAQPFESPSNGKIRLQELSRLSEPAEHALPQPDSRCARRLPSSRASRCASNRPRDTDSSRESSAPGAIGPRPARAKTSRGFP